MLGIRNSSRGVRTRNPANGQYDIRLMLTIMNSEHRCRPTILEAQGPTGSNTSSIQRVGPS
ncbi:hypothetical protein ACWDYH_39430 [Nocardia goodfellowii]